MNAPAVGTTMATTPGPATSSTSTPPNDEEAAFARATEKLLYLGAVPVVHYLQEPALVIAPPATLPPAPQPPPPSAPPKASTESFITRAVARLHQACQQTFGNTEALRYEFEDDPATQGKRCKLTITRPNGPSRIYTSPNAYQRKYDAKAHISTVAIENGAIDFIISGDGKGDEHASSTQEPGSTASLEMDESVKLIEQTCLEWTYGRIKPFWLLINEPKFGRTQGYALRIRLGPRNSRVWSVGTVYATTAEAKKACAEAAIADGILDYIRTWSSSWANVTVDEPGSEFPNSAIGLQEFFDALPKPFPEQVAGQTAADINGPAWLNTTIQSARGGKIVPNFIWTTDPKLGFHGCLLRLERPGEVKSYLVDARFAKRAEAKAAVCLLAMSEGVGEYIRGVAKAVEEKLPAATRKHIAEVLMPIFNAEYRRVHGPGLQPPIEYDMDLDACGATMTIELVSSPTPQQVRKYTVPAEYRNRNEAKLAVIAHAVEQGVIEFLRFQGRPPPPGYIPNYTQHESYYMNRKRKYWEGGAPDWAGPGGGGGWQNNKKPRIGGEGFANYQGAQGGGYGTSQKPGWNGQKTYSNMSWTRANGPGSGQFGDAAGPSRAAGHFQPGPRNVGAPPAMHNPVPAAHAPYPAVGGGAPMQPQSVPAAALAPAPYAYPAGGAQPPNTPYYSAQPQQAAYPGALAQVQSYGAPSPGGAYPGYYTPQQQQPVAGVQANLSYLQQYNYGAPYATTPTQGQLSGYPQYPPVSVQYPSAPSQPAYYPQPPAAVPTPPVPATPTPPAYYPAAPAVPVSSSPPVPVASPAYPQYSYGTHAPVQPTPPPVQPTPPIAQPPPAPPAPPVVPPPLPRTTPAHSPPPPAPPLQPAPPTTAPPPPPPPPPAPPAIPPPPPPPPPTKVPSKPAPPPDPKPPSVAPLSMSNRPPNENKKPPVVVVESVPKTAVAELYDHCRNAGMPDPEYRSEVVQGQGDPRFKVWVIIGKMRFELPVTFPSLGQGQEKVAKKILGQFRQARRDEAPKS